MKVLKRAEQQNFTIDKNFYRPKEINEMLLNHEICHFGRHYEELYSQLQFYEIDDERMNLRIFASNLDRIEIVYLKEYGYYKTVAIGKNGKTYYINI